VAGWTPARQRALLALEEDFRNQYRDLLVATRQEENDLLALRAQEATQSIHQTGWAFIFTFGTAFFFTGYTLLLWRRDNLRQSQLRETELKLTTVIENAPMIFFTFDREGVVGVSEGRGLENIGVKPGASVGKSIFELYRAEPGILQNTRRALAGEKFTAVASVKGKFLEMSYTPLKDGEGRVSQVLGVALDVTERVAAEEKLRLYTHRLEDNNRDLQEFVFVASHDLQEPLRKIQAFGGFLAEELGTAAPESAMGYLKRMRDAAARMGLLIEDLLQWTRVSTRGKPFVAVELSQVLRDVVADLELSLKETGGKVEVGPLPMIEADPAQMWQLFQNLIANSLKFRKKDVPPVVTLQARAEGPANRVVLTLRDNGIGFEQKYADRIFNIFQRLHGPQEYKGSGVGLAVCRKVVERHNGAITALGAPGEGATFEIVLPLRQVKEDPEEAEAAGVQESRAV
ncbi:MAG TPA: ATP-binding protein, partial [bacterium]|nr:ATP-binding protein [bacterium]